MKDPIHPSQQQKDPVADARVESDSDLDAEVQDSPLKVHGDALLHGTSTAHGEKKDDVRRDDQR